MISYQNMIPYHIESCNILQYYRHILQHHVITTIQHINIEENIVRITI